MDDKHLKHLQDALSYQFNNPELLSSACCHSSFFNETDDVPYEHNERLEFLGDSVLGLIVAEWLYQEFSDDSEGNLSQNRAYLVQATSCIRYINELKLKPFLKMGQGELRKGKITDSLLADFFESLLGAIYLDGGLEAARKFLKQLRPIMLSILKDPPENYKVLLQEYLQRDYHAQPHYKLVEEIGPDHQREFVMAVCFDGKELARGKGLSKKIAEGKAARIAYIQLKKGLNEQS